ncbi:hypothetical protein M5E06_33445 [Azospirillum sp. A1-3]|uniref:hypothetical protein n=1 Tax=Azospirillum sp. A1-3 TaxID=185874 RepID=UPI0020773F22|nr:hypothetical protein [Azospirillum sp. A1-3]MCM8735778.1 hypothetical protein [Azospirillum sp. A1-3]MCM8738677.1 hypothetical protein [Azospirillum sp. A1-3]MCM8738992.1 hypothetical protein [Azospirillum sp. A1-3]
MTAARRCKVLGKWRLIEADQWDRAYLDLVEPAYIRFDVDGRGEMVFGALQAGLECETGVSTIFFDFEGSDEMTPIRGTGTVELAEDGSLEVEISIHHGDEIQLKAHRW